MKKALLIVSVLCIAVVSTACINNIAVQELNNKAAAYMQKGEYEEAMNRLQASLDLDATMYETYYNLGVAAINAHKYEKAIKALEDGIKIKPDFTDFYYSLGLAQSSFADEILDFQITGDNNSNSAEKKELSEADKARALELKKASNENLKKYIVISPDSKDRATIEALIIENENFLNDNSKKETVVD